MGLDMRPMGKPKPGFEKRFDEIFQMIQKDRIPVPTFFEKLMGKKLPTRDELLKEWFDNTIKTYETIRAPQVGRDAEADDWVKAKYAESNKSVSEQEFMQGHAGFYVIELAKETDGVPVYVSFNQDENVFRGQILNDCVGLIGKDLVDEAWETKLAADTLDYGKRLMKVADEIASQNNLVFLKDQRLPPNEGSGIEQQLHIVYSLAKWLIFYGKNGHGYEADF
ncbi:MAG: hypothetical protein HOP30_21490 [Cyclobacteriaceae bacterium]|nr:hypothetical protein [Cyclobacteriaceae bacterium]